MHLSSEYMQYSIHIYSVYIVFIHAFIYIYMNIQSYRFSEIHGFDRFDHSDPSRPYLRCWFRLTLPKIHEVEWIDIKN